MEGALKVLEHFADRIKASPDVQVHDNMLDRSALPLQLSIEQLASLSCATWRDRVAYYENLWGPSPDGPPSE